MPAPSLSSKHEAENNTDHQDQDKYNDVVGKTSTFMLNVHGKADKILAVSRCDLKVQQDTLKKSRQEFQEMNGCAK